MVVPAIGSPIKCSSLILSDASKYHHRLAYRTVPNNIIQQWDINPPFKELKNFDFSLYPAPPHLLGRFEDTSCVVCYTDTLK